MREELKHSLAASSIDEVMVEEKLVQVIFSAGRQFYAVPEVRRECGIWLSIEKHPLPVPVEWRRPHSVAAAIMPGRNYYRIAVFAPQHTDGSKGLATDDELVRDYYDAAWWTPGLEEAWAQNTKARESNEKREAELKQMLAEAHTTAESLRQALEQTKDQLVEVTRRSASEAVEPVEPLVAVNYGRPSAPALSSSSEGESSNAAAELALTGRVPEGIAGYDSSRCEAKTGGRKAQVRLRRGKKNAG